MPQWIPLFFDTYGVKRGLRDKAGNGVVAGLTNISDVSAYWFDEQGQQASSGRKTFLPWL